MSAAEPAESDRQALNELFSVTYEELRRLTETAGAEVIAAMRHSRGADLHVRVAGRRVFERDARAHADVDRVIARRGPVAVFALVFERRVGSPVAATVQRPLHVQLVTAARHLS